MAELAAGQEQKSGLHHKRQYYLLLKYMLLNCDMVAHA